MHSLQHYHQEILQQLRIVSSKDNIASIERYFPAGIKCLGAKAAGITIVIKHFHANNSDLSADEVLAISEYVLAHNEFNEEVLVAFGLITKLVKKHYNDDLLQRFEYWLEHYASNWAHVDDLCLKTIYNFLLARPHLIEQTQRWSYSKVTWCRRASNVVWVKFIKRKIGRSLYYLDKSLVFKSCDLLLTDQDEFVQKSIGWLLKVTLVEHEADVVEYLKVHYKKMPRSTIRYALEKLDADKRKALMNTLA